MNLRYVVLCSALFLVGFATNSQEAVSEDCIGWATPIQHLEKRGFLICYDKRTRIPLYVYERLSKSSVEGEFERGSFEFSEDRAISKPFRATLSDYKGSGFDRGHICPAANCVGSQDGMKDSFLLSNICPQHPNCNRGYWAKLEKHVRNLTGECDFLEVFTGCLFLPKMCKDGKKRVIYEVIGDGSVAVPTHLFKVVRKHLYHKVVEEAYMVPNKQIDREASLDQFLCTVEEIERWLGLKLHASQ